MASVKISALPAATSIGSADTIPIVQGGTTKGGNLGTVTIGAATVTTINKLTLTAPSSSATLTIANGKVATVNSTLTLTGTDGTTMTFPGTSATVARTDAANTFTGHQTIEGVTSTGATGTGQMVFDTSPTLTMPKIAKIVAPSDSTTAVQVTKADGTTAVGTWDTTNGNLTLGSGSNPAAAFLFGTNNGFNVDGGNHSIMFKVAASNRGCVQSSNIPGFEVPAANGYSWSFNSTPDSAHDTILTRSTAGVIQFGTTTNNASGSWLATNGTLSGTLITTPQTLSGAGAINVTTSSTAFTSTGVGNALTLADGTNGQIKFIAHVSDGGSGVLTPTTKSGYSTITFTNVGDSVTLQFFTTAGWCIMGSYGVTIAP